MTRLWFARVLALSVVLVPVAREAQAQTPITVSPSAVDVSSVGATTAFLTFHGLSGASSPVGPAGPIGPSIAAAVPAEAFWCGRVISASPDRGQRCDPATIYGSLPAGLNQTQVVGGAFTDIMSVTPTVARSAYQAAQAGSGPTFYYVRRFTRAGGSDEFVPVTLRLIGAASAAFALTDVIASFPGDPPVLFLEAGAVLPPISIALQFTGTGVLKGRFELVQPGDDLPVPRDLLTEATLPVAERGTQRRYTEISRFNEFLPSTGRYTLRGPDVSHIPTTVDGTYFVLFRVEASYDPQQPAGSSQAGPTAGFAMPALRFIVGTKGSAIAPRPIDAPVKPLFPAPGAKLTPGHAMDFSWVNVPDTVFYRLEIAREDDGTVVLSAIVPHDLATYRAPQWLADRSGGKPLHWRVEAIDSTGRTIGTSPWSRLLPPGGM